MPTGDFHQIYRLQGLFSEYFAPPAVTPEDEKKLRQLNKRVEDLVDQLQAIRDRQEIQDHDRMDWIVKNPNSLRMYNGGDWYTDADNRKSFRCPRAAIDHAIEIDREERRKRIEVK